MTAAPAPAGGELPAGLRARVLEASRRARAAGRSVPEVSEIAPVEAFRRAADALYGTLRALSGEDWRRPAIRDLDVQGLVGHLTGVEHDLQRALAGDPAVGRAGHVESTQGAAVRQAGRSPAETLGEWHDAAADTLTQVAERDGTSAIIALHGLELPLNAWLVARAFELWTHENDIRLASGLQAAVPDAATLTLMTRLAVGLLPHAVAGTGLGRAARVHLVLTGPGGGTWDVEVGDGGAIVPDPARASIVTDAAGFCRLVANRASPAGMELHITGDQPAAAGVLAAAASLALD